MVWSNNLDGYELLPPFRNNLVREYRVYHRIKKSRIWYVGSRMYEKKGEK